MKSKIFLFLFFASVSVFADEVFIYSGDAAKNTGRLIKVCGYAAEVTKESSSAGQPWVIDMGAANPSQDISIIIWERDEAKFGDIAAYKGSSICVTGKIEPLKAKPVMIISSPAQIEYYKPPRKPTKEEKLLESNARVMMFVYKPRTIKMLKKILKDCGYVPGDMSENWILDSHRTVIAYQTAKKIKTTGLIDKKTLEALQRDCAQSGALDEKTKRLYFDELEKLFEFW